MYRRAYRNRARTNRAEAQAKALVATAAGRQACSPPRDTRAFARGIQAAAPAIDCGRSPAATVETAHQASRKLRGAANALPGFLSRYPMRYPNWGYSKKRP